MTTTAVRAIGAYAALNASHDVGDFWGQRDADAGAKGKCGWEGRAACARHVASYTATQAVALLAADRALRLGLDWRRAAAGLAVSAVTHYVADRSGGRWREKGPSTALVRFARRTGHTKWLKRDPGAGLLLDQSWHKGWIAVAAVIAGGGK
ncbi:hypothetical protein [Streptomyces sp. NPDC051992]|uniref:hypothetical protein n=1 Tax=Streptomyces sp. NPDC051992 TaxID=3161012 RepID=UPI00342FEED8